MQGMSYFKLSPYVSVQLIEMSRRWSVCRFICSSGVGAYIRPRTARGCGSWRNIGAAKVKIHGKRRRS